jgi:S-adenosylmethionine:tRNA ribosyltransferase-isomerase
MRTDELDYELPSELIAQTPAPRRDQARLMVVRLGTDEVHHRRIADLPAILSPRDLLVINDTRVLPARFHATRLSTGGHVEGLFLQTSDGDDTRWVAMLKSGGRLLPGDRLDFPKLSEGPHQLHLIEQQPGGTWVLEKRSPLSTEALLERVGSMPLPPYIRRERKITGGTESDAADRARYQTVYADRAGAVAAPTAGLHFTSELMAALREMGVQFAPVTLHVGMGTFAPVRTETLEKHAMHRERFAVPAATLAALFAARVQKRRVIAVGTTSVRALESLPPDLDSSRDYCGETRLLIQPGFNLRFTDGLLTNFHLPRSTLLALVAAITGMDRLRNLYQVAIAERYRFYSYGDAMLILP